MKHISELHIQQFRGLKNLILHDLGEVNLFVGGNNSGKTSVLEAISTFCRPLDLAEWLNTARRRELMLSSVSILESLRWIFPQSETQTSDNLFRGETRVTGTGSFPIRSVMATFNEIKGELISSNQEMLMDISRRGVDLKITAIVNSEPEIITSLETISKTFQLWEDEHLIHPESTTCPMLPVRTIFPHAHRVERIQIQQLSENAFQELNSLALQILKDFDPDVESLNIWSPSGRTSNLYIKHKKLGLAPFSSFGDAMRRVTLISTTIPLCQNGILMIDEIETAIHTQALQKTFDWLVKACIQYNVQLFATTHSLEAVDAILEASAEDINLVSYRLQQRAEQTTATRLDKALLQRLREVLGREVRW